MRADEHLAAGLTALAGANRARARMEVVARYAGATRMQVSYTLTP